MRSTALYYVRYDTQVSQYIEEVYEPDGCFIKIRLDRKRIKLLKVSHFYQWWSIWWIMDTSGTSHFVLYREVVLSIQRIKCTSIIEKEPSVPFIESVLYSKHL